MLRTVSLKTSNRSRLKRILRLTMHGAVRVCASHRNTLQGLNHGGAMAGLCRSSTPRVLGGRLVPGGCEEDGEAAGAVVEEGDVVGGCGWFAGVVPAADG